VDLLVSPILLYGACALGGLGVALALPRKRVSPFVLGALVGAIALGALFIGLGLKYPNEIPNIHFYVFSFIALGAAMRVITHARPVYAALYFVLTILASCGLYLILSAEFLAFALVIVYAGAILITYLFVIMLATEGPTGDAVGALNEYDRVSREPIIATLAGFVLLGGLTTALAVGSAGLTPNAAKMTGEKPLAVMPKKVEKVLREAKLPDGKPVLLAGEKLAMSSDKVRDTLAAANVIKADQWPSIMPRNHLGEPAYAISSTTGTSEAGAGWLVLTNDKGELRILTRAQWPEDLYLTNTEGVAFDLIDGHPGAIEIAGVILLMAMIGATVLGRKKVDMDDAARAEVAAKLREFSDLGPHLGEQAPFVAPNEASGETDSNAVGVGGMGGTSR
jgi:NADH-quinone oxidoreductase subunit J